MYIRQKSAISLLIYYLYTIEQNVCIHVLYL